MNTPNRPQDWEDPVSLPDVELPRRLLVAFDGSHNAERALAWAERVAALHDTEVVVVVAYEQPMTMRGRGATYIEEARMALEQEAKDLAAEAVQLLLERGRAGRAVVVRGDVPHAILDVAESEDCGLVLIGRQGISAEVGGLAGSLERVRNLLEGGVTDKVVRHAVVPVIVVP